MPVSFRDREYIENRLLGTAPSAIHQAIGRCRQLGLTERANQLTDILYRTHDEYYNVIRELRKNGYTK